jgi:hypothetical protein
MLLRSRNLAVIDAARDAASFTHRAFRVQETPWRLETELRGEQTLAVDLTLLPDPVPRGWADAYRGLHLILVVPLRTGHPEREVQVLAECCYQLHPYRPTLLIGDDAVDALAWGRAFRDAMGLQSRIVQSITRELADTPRRWDDVLVLLAEAPNLRLLHALPNLKAMQQRLLRAGQHAPKTLTLVFRALWAAHLEEARMSRADIAHRLGFNSPDEYTARITAVFGLGKREFDQISTSTLARWIATQFLYTPSHCGVDPTTLGAYCTVQGR